MNRWLGRAAAGAARAVRGLWPDRNPLRRSYDRAEALALGGLAVAFLAGAPLAAATAHHISYGLGARAAHAQQSWRQVRAVLLTDAPASVYAAETAEVPARWTAPDGVPRTGPVPASPTAKAGTAVMVWVDGSGKPAGATPLRLSQVRMQALLAAILAAVVLAQVLVAVGGAVHWALERRRLAAWDAEWQLAEPRWTRRKRI